MTFLELVQELHRESGASGRAPTTVANLVGEGNRLVGWIRSADIYIQSLWENWKFLRQEYNEVTAIGSTALPVAQTAKWWDEATFKIKYAGETSFNPIEVVEYDEIKSEVRSTDNEIPSRIILMPDNSLELEAPADAVHTIKADFYRTPVELAVDADISIIPATYHRAILGRALILYANYENADEQKNQGQEIYTEQLARLENNQLPNQNNARFRTGGSFEVVAE